MNKPASSHSSNNPMRRRQFLRYAAATAGAALAAPALLRGQNLNNKLDIVVIGAGGRGSQNLKEFGGENIVALCDVAEDRLAKAAAGYPQAKKFTDFRKLYEEMKNFDAAVVSTAEHAHVFALLPALRQGKHVYCEKPVTHSIEEARLVAEVARKSKAATQMGTQMHANPVYHRVVELVQTGAIGPVREAHVWVSRAWGWQSVADAKANKDIYLSQEKPPVAAPVPAGLHWDLFLGPARTRPFSEAYWPGPRWYRWWDFGSGTMSDLGSHMNDLPFWALKLRHPKIIEADGPPPHPDIAPASMLARYQYEACGEMPPVTVTWYQGALKPRLFTEGKIPQWTNGILFVGDGGMILADYKKHVLLPEDKFKDFKAPAPFLSDARSHHEEWVLACKTGSPTGSNFDYAGALTEANHLGNLAYRLGKKLTWDPVALKAVNCPEADALIRKTYHNGWKL